MEEEDKIPVEFQGGRYLHCISFRLDLGRAEKTVAQYIASKMDFTKNYKEGRYESVKTIGKRIGYSPRRVYEALHSLYLKGFIKRQIRMRSDFSRKASAIFLTRKFFDDYFEYKENGANIEMFETKEQMDDLSYGLVDDFFKYEKSAGFDEISAQPIAKNDTKKEKPENPGGSQTEVFALPSAKNDTTQCEKRHSKYNKVEYNPNEYNPILYPGDFQSQGTHLKIIPDENLKIKKPSPETDVVGTPLLLPEKKNKLGKVRNSIPEKWRSKISEFDNQMAQKWLEFALEQQPKAKYNLDKFKLTICKFRIERDFSEEGVEELLKFIKGDYKFWRQNAISPVPLLNPSNSDPDITKLDQVISDYKTKSPLSKDAKMIDEMQAWIKNDEPSDYEIKRANYLKKLEEEQARSNQHV